MLEAQGKDLAGGDNYAVESFIMNAEWGELEC